MIFQKTKNTIKNLFIGKKKTITIVFLFFIMLGITAPQITLASWSCYGGAALGVGPGAGAGAIGGSIIPGVGTGAGAVIGGAVGAIVGCIKGIDIATPIGKELLAGAGKLLRVISSTLFNISASLFNSITSDPILQQSITKNSVVVMGWGIVRDFANMFVVLGFVVIGIATILRVREYEAQKLLLPLIIIALLINFSPMICGLVIDASNIMMNYFLGGINAGGVATGAAVITVPFSNAINNSDMNQLIDDSAKNNDWLAYTSGALSVSIFAGVAAMIFFIYGILLLFRYVALMLLVILSPLAFVCYAFPKTKSIFDKWWNQFIQWAFIGVTTAFFMYLAGHLIQGFGLGKAVISPSSLDFWVPTAFLLFAYSLIFQTSALGASAAIGLATGAVGYAAGASKWAGGKALRGAGAATGASRVGSYAKSKVLGLAEKMRLVAPGASTKAERTSVDGYKKDFARLNGQQISDNLNKKAIWTRPGVRQRAALAELAIERGVFDPNNARHVAGLKDAQARGFTLTPEHIEKDARLAPLDAGTMENLTRPIAKGGKGLSQPAAEVEATKQVVEGMSGREARNKMSARSLGDINTAKHMNLLQADEMDKASKKKKAALKDFAVGGVKQAEWDAHVLATASPARQAELMAMQARFGTYIL